MENNQYICSRCGRILVRRDEVVPVCEVCGIKEVLGCEDTPAVDACLSIGQWQKLIHDICVEKGWYDRNRNPFELLFLVHSELSEAGEEIRNGKGLREVYYSGDNLKKPEGVPIELADTVIRILDLCEYWGIDLEAAIRTKIEYNKTRPVRHGGKLA